MASFIRKFGDRDVALRRPRPVQGRNTLEGVATRHASRSAQRTDPTFPDRLNFGGRQVVGVRCPLTGLTMQLAGFDAAKGKNPDANGEIALVGNAAAAAAREARVLPYGPKVRRAQGTNSLRNKNSTPHPGPPVEAERE